MLKISGKQCKTARGLLKWNPHDLANHASGVKPKRIESFERGAMQLLAWENDELLKAFKAAGVAFKGDQEVTLQGSGGGDQHESGGVKQGGDGVGARIVLDGEQNVVSDSSAGITPPIPAALRDEDEKKRKDKE